MSEQLVLRVDELAPGDLVELPGGAGVVERVEGWQGRDELAVVVTSNRRGRLAARVLRRDSWVRIVDQGRQTAVQTPQEAS